MRWVPFRSLRRRVTALETETKRSAPAEPEPVRNYDIPNECIPLYHDFLLAAQASETPICSHEHKPGRACASCWLTVPAVAEAWARFSARQAEIEAGDL